MVRLVLTSYPQQFVGFVEHQPSQLLHVSHRRPDELVDCVLVVIEPQLQHLVDLRGLLAQVLQTQELRLRDLEELYKGL